MEPAGKPGTVVVDVNIGSANETLADVGCGDWREGEFRGAKVASFIGDWNVDGRVSV